MQGSHCQYLPLTSDGWFTMDWRPASTIVELVQGPAHPFHRLSELELIGMQPNIRSDCVQILYGTSRLALQ